MTQKSQKNYVRYLCSCLLILRKSSRDRISELPDEILLYIISRLTLREAVRTTVLSSRWKHLAISSRSELVFDYQNLFEIPENLKSGDGCMCGHFRARFVRLVNQFLSSVYCSTRICIKRFTIEFCLGKEYQEDIDKWVRFALANGTENLSVELYCPKKMSKLPNYGGLKYLEKCVFPRLLPVQRYDPRLKSLGLKGCFPEQNLIDNRIFECVEILKLGHLDLAHYDLSTMFSHLKKLRELFFTNCDLPKNIAFESSLDLNTFSLAFSTGLRRIKLSSAKLESLHCICNSPNEIEVLGGVGPSSIKDFRFATVDGSPQYVFNHLPQEVPNLENLVFYVRNNHNWGYSNAATFPRVTDLRMIIHYQNFDLDLSKMIRSLKSFPQLKTLVIMNELQPSFINYDHDGDMYEHLELIVISGFYGTSKEIQLLIHLLTHSPAIKQLVINPAALVSPLAEGRVAKQPCMSKEQRREIRQRLRLFSRVKIVFH